MKGSKASFSRRLFLTRGAVLGAAAAVGTVSSADGRTIRGELPWAPGGTDPPTPVTGKETYAFFTPDEAAFIEAEVARLIPADDFGPGSSIEFNQYRISTLAVPVEVLSSAPGNSFGK